MRLKISVFAKSFNLIVLQFIISKSQTELPPDLCPLYLIGVLRMDSGKWFMIWVSQYSVIWDLRET